MQRFHMKHTENIGEILQWLNGLPAEKVSGVPVHHIQSFQVVTVPDGYVGILLCQHSQQANQAIRESLTRIPAEFVKE